MKERSIPRVLISLILIIIFSNYFINEKDAFDRSFSNTFLPASIFIGSIISFLFEFKNPRE